MVQLHDKIQGDLCVLFIEKRSILTSYSFFVKTVWYSQNLFQTGALLKSKVKIFCNFITKIFCSGSVGRGGEGRDDCVSSQSPSLWETEAQGAATLRPGGSQSGTDFRCSRILQRFTIMYFTLFVADQRFWQLILILLIWQFLSKYLIFFVKKQKTKNKEWRNMMVRGGTIFPGKGRAGTSCQAWSNYPTFLTTENWDWNTDIEVLTTH